MLDIPLSCPSCGREFKKSLDGLRNGTRFGCPSCGHTIVIEGDGATRVADKLRDLERSFKNFKLNIRL
jgi:predicted RNA-binding Zn-ribbon protein involved in translation (DUF1610 family)